MVALEEILALVISMVTGFPDVFQIERWSYFYDFGHDKNSSNERLPAIFNGFRKEPQKNHILFFWLC